MKEKVIFLFRIGTLILSLYILGVQFVLINTGIFTQAEIVKERCQILPVISFQYCQIVLRFATLDEKFVEYPLSFQESFMVSKKVGDQIGVFYDKNNPKNVKVNSFLGKYLSIIFSTVVGLTALFFNSKPVKLLDDLT